MKPLLWINLFFIFFFIFIFYLIMNFYMFIINNQMLNIKFKLMLNFWKW